MTECLFCKIRDGEIPSDTVYEDDHILAFKDVNPHAPVHILIVPKKHISTINDLKSEDAEIMGKMLLAAQDIASSEGVAADGYRLVVNTNADAGQTVHHIHMHLLGGRNMAWPPG